jgi:hypothetical protein
MVRTRRSADQTAHLMARIDEGHSAAAIAVAMKRFIPAIRAASLFLESRCVDDLLLSDLR